MEHPHEMTTLSEAMNSMRNKGYVNDFDVYEEGLIVKKNNKKYSPENVIIKKVFRFEGDSNPDDMSILYAIESNDGDKGLLVDAYGLYANNELDGLTVAKILKKIKIEE